MNHQRAEIAVAPFADADQAGTPSTGSLFRHQAEPGCELPAILEAGSIAYGSNQCSRGHRADAFDLRKPLALLAGTEDFPYPTIIDCNAIVEVSHFFLQFPHEGSNHFAETVIVVSHNDCEAAP